MVLGRVGERWTAGVEKHWALGGTENCRERGWGEALSCSGAVREHRVPWWAGASCGRGARNRVRAVRLTASSLL